MAAAFPELPKGSHPWHTASSTLWGSTHWDSPPPGSPEASLVGKVAGQEEGEDKAAASPET